MIKTLVEKGADITVKNKAGKTPAQCLAASANTEIKALLGSTQTGSTGGTPLKNLETALKGLKAKLAELAGKLATL